MKQKRRSEIGQILVDKQPKGIKTTGSLKNILRLCGAFLIIITLINLPGKYEEYKVAREGTLVKMHITGMRHIHISKRSKEDITFEYNGEQYIKYVRARIYNQHHLDEVVDMKFLNGSEKIMFPHETGKMELLALILLLMFGLGTVIYSAFTKV
jgi:hypothetical protein